MAKRKSKSVVDCKRKEKTGGMRKEPAGNINSLEHVLWELDIINAQRAAKGKAPLSYGKYVSTRDEN